MSKKLIMYYSFDGNTREIAEVMAKSIGADIQEVKPEKEMKSKGFGKFFWGGSQVVMGKKPAISDFKVNLDDYDTIIIGSPIWASSFAPPIKTLIEDKLKDKKIAYFYCHDGGPGKALEKAKAAISVHNTFLSAVDFTSVSKNLESCKTKAIEWVSTL